MTTPFTAFVAPLSWQQVSLLLDTVQYFEDAPKLISLPSEHGESIPVAITAETLNLMLGCLDEKNAFERKQFTMHWESDSGNQGVLVVGLPTGDSIRQPADLSLFSAV